MPVCCPMWRSRINDPHKQLINALTFLLIGTPDRDTRNRRPAFPPLLTLCCPFIAVTYSFSLSSALPFYLLSSFVYPSYSCIFFSLLSKKIYFLSQSYSMISSCVSFSSAYFSLPFIFVQFSSHIKMIKHKENKLNIHIVPQR